MQQQQQNNRYSAKFLGICWENIQCHLLSFSQQVNHINITFSQQVSIYAIFSQQDSHNIFNQLSFSQQVKSYIHYIQLVGQAYIRYIKSIGQSYIFNQWVSHIYVIFNQLVQSYIYIISKSVIFIQTVGQSYLFRQKYLHYIFSPSYLS